MDGASSQPGIACYVVRSTGQDASPSSQRPCQSPRKQVRSHRSAAPAEAATAQPNQPHAEGLVHTASDVQSCSFAACGTHCKLLLTPYCVSNVCCTSLQGLWQHHLLLHLLRARLHGFASGHQEGTEADAGGCCCTAVGGLRKLSQLWMVSVCCSKCSNCSSFTVPQQMSHLADVIVTDTFL